jgi:hypothetical protein
MVPRWSGPDARRWFEDDARWLDLCDSLRRDEVLGSSARSALRWATVSRVKEAVARVRRSERAEERRARSSAPAIFPGLHVTAAGPMSFSSSRGSPATSNRFELRPDWRALVGSSELLSTGSPNRRLPRYRQHATGLDVSHVCVSGAAGFPTGPETVAAALVHPAQSLT